MVRKILVLMAAMLPLAGGTAVLLPHDGVLNPPQSATISSESSKLVIPTDASRIDYTYDGTGVKHQTVHTTVTKYTLGNKVLTRTKRDTTRYVGSRIYENGQLDRVLTPYGYIKDGVHHTFLHDYQGNVAAVVAGDSLVQRTSYYPYGLPHANAHGATANPYKYGGKEFDTFGGTDLYDFHARYHAPSTGRFLTVDNHGEKYPEISIYSYCGGNPVRNIDPSGNDFFDWFLGFTSAVSDNIMGGTTKLRENAAVNVNDSGDFNAGLESGDRASLAIGTIEQISGLHMSASGAFDIVGGTALAPVTGGVSSAVSAVGLSKIAAGSALLGHGLMMNASGSRNLNSGKGKISESTNQETITFIQGTGERARKIKVTIPKGYHRVKGNCHGKKIFTNGKNYISPDADGHNGAIWKMADKIEDFKNRKTRLGSYDESLEHRLSD